MNISGKTQLIGLIGWPVEHSFSPAMHNAAAADLGLDFVYVALPVRPGDVETAVRGLAALGFRGVNVTIPHKQAVMPFLHEIAAGARAIGAVNTIVVNRGQFAVGSGQGAVDSGQWTGERSQSSIFTLQSSSKLVGYNTDWSGFLADLTARGVEVDGRSCLILGAGGSARGVAYGLARAGGQVQVLARRVEQAQTLVDEIGPRVDGAGWLNAWPLRELETAVRAATAPLIVNTTPLGMSPHVETSVWPDDLAFPAGAFAYDLVYNPVETRFIRQAQAAGCQSANGLGMLLHQGAQAFALWTGREANLAVMAAALGYIFH
jgi:shikimate dehydrogenase